MCIEIREAKRAGARLVIGIAGVSGSGKTYTAIQLAYGLAGYDSSKIGVLDTENRRGSLYADILRDRDGKRAPFAIGDLYAPFSPQRYIDAIHAFVKAGVEVLVIDSVTHEWEGLGGCTDIAENTTGKMANWKLAKREHNRYMNVLLSSPMHIIVCIRAREKVKITNGGAKVEALGIQPVCEKNFMFELTASMLMENAGRSQQSLKCPADLVNVLGRGGDYITAADGYALRQWVDGADVQVDPKVEAYRGRLLSQTEQGAAHIEACWGKVPAHIRSAIGEGGYTQILDAARAFDAERERAAATANDGDDGGESVEGAFRAAATTGE